MDFSQYSIGDQTHSELPGTSLGESKITSESAVSKSPILKTDALAISGNENLSGSATTNQQKIADFFKSPEELYKEVKKAFRPQTKSFENTDKFIQLAESVHIALQAQDSDMALKIITKGALSMGCSDVHYDLTELKSTIRFRID